MSIVYDILLKSQKPLHVSEIISKAKDDFNVDLDRESIVSAIIKKVKSGRMFKRVAPNTFTYWIQLQRKTPDIILNRGWLA